MLSDYTDSDYKIAEAAERARVLSVSADFNRRYRRHRIEKRVARYLSISEQSKAEFRHHEIA